MKKSISLFLVCSLIIVLFSSCSGPAKVRVNGEKVDNEIYRYFENEVKQRALEDIDVDSAVKESISRYVTVNSEFANRSLSLTSGEKTSLSETVNNIWHFYGAYYDKIGVSKQTVYKIEASKAYERALLNYYYSAEGISPLDEEEIKKYFSENYVAVRFVAGYLFNIDEKGATVPMTEEQKNAYVDSFNSVAAMINNGTSVEEAIVSLDKEAEVSDNLVYSGESGNLPDGFFNAAKNIEINKSAAIALNDYIFLVQRVDVFSEEFNYYSTYRTDCLEKMKYDEFSSVIDEWAKNYVAE